MIALYYEILFLLSVLLATVYVFVWRRHFDITFSVMFTLVPIVCLGYTMMAHSTTLSEAIMATKIVYLGGSFLQYFIMLSIMSLCKIHISKWFKRILFICCVILYSFVLTIGYKPYFYKEFSMEIVDGEPLLHKTYGFMHSIFFVGIILIFAVNLTAITYSFFKKKQVSRRIMYLLFLPDLLCMMSYFVGRLITQRFDIIPSAYVFAELMYILIIRRLTLYDINETAIDSLMQTGNTGFISLDLRQRYLGSNETARKIIPALNDLYVDKKITEGGSAVPVPEWIARFVKDENDHEFVYTVPAKDSAEGEDDRIYVVEASYLYDDKRRCGFIFTLTDDTQNRKYIRLLDHYNEDLQTEVRIKTQHIEEMHTNLIMSLAMMVESRDNSTGGHIKRTSTGVKLLIEEILKDDRNALSPEFCKDIIKAAPMHDLGKIAVDDAILRKPGRFTPEEFEKMKLHAAEGARVIHEILKKTDDESFHILAENIAHYHHERWDGSGYPDGLKGEQIPLEARIMAIADVYDALVSKRVYKDSMSFEQADSIILSGMGTQFDPGLKEYYISARPKLEAYYSSLENETAPAAVTRPQAV